MPEDFVGPAAAQRLRSCILGSHLDTFSAGLLALGHEIVDDPGQAAAVSARPRCGSSSS